MPARTPPRNVYWDSSVFLSYINGEEDRVGVVTALLDEAEASELAIYTSRLSTVEVAFANAEKGIPLDDDVERRIDELWRIAKLIDVHALVCRDARTLMRMWLPDGMAPKPADSIHLATARLLVTTAGVSEVHTFEKGEKWQRHSPWVGCKIDKPTSGTFNWGDEPSTASSRPS